MRTRLSTKGQLVLPQALRDKLGLRPGDPLDASIEGERIILVPSRKRVGKGRIIKDPETGLPVLSAGKNSPKLTGKQVAAILAEFP